MSEELDLECKLDFGPVNLKRKPHMMEPYNPSPGNIKTGESLGLPHWPACLTSSASSGHSVPVSTMRCPGSAMMVSTHLDSKDDRDLIVSPPVLTEFQEIVEWKPRGCSAFGTGQVCRASFLC